MLPRNLLANTCVLSLRLLRILSKKQEINCTMIISCEYFAGAFIQCKALLYNTLVKYEVLDRHPLVTLSTDPCYARLSSHHKPQSYLGKRNRERWQID